MQHSVLERWGTLGIFLSGNNTVKLFLGRMFSICPFKIEREEGVVNNIIRIPLKTIDSLILLYILVVE